MPTENTKPWYTAELLFTADGREAGWWSPSAYGLEADCDAHERPEGLRHLLNARELRTEMLRDAD